MNGVPGVQIVEGGRKIHEEKKNEGRLSLSFPVYNLTRSPLTAALYYLNAWNRLSSYWKCNTAR